MCVLVLCTMLVIALAVQVLPAFIAKQQLDTFATELVREAEIAGRVGSETNRREQALREQTGLDPTVQWSDTGRIQLNEEVSVTLTYEIDLGLFAGFGSFSHHSAGGCHRKVGGVLEMNKLRQILKDQRGVAFPLIIAIVLVLVMLMCCISEYFRLLIVAQGVRDAVQEAVISTVNDNYDDVYHGVREGYPAPISRWRGDFEESLDYGDIYGRLDDILGLTYRSGYPPSTRRTAPQSFVSGASMWRSATRRLLLATAPVTVLWQTAKSNWRSRYRFGGELLPPMRMTVKVSAGYTPRF